MKKISGGTAFYDGMWTTLDLLRRVKDSRKAILVLTDGVDESSLGSDYERSDHSFEELLVRISEEDDLPIYLNREEAELSLTRCRACEFAILGITMEPRKRRDLFKKRRIAESQARHRSSAPVPWPVR